MKVDPKLEEAIKREGWKIVSVDGVKQVQVYAQLYPLVHPLTIHLKIYRDERNPEIKYFHMKRAHDLLWPHMIESWNYWDERRFRAHCEDWKYISYAGAASTGKSDCEARIIDLWWLADPKRRVAIVASTTLDSLNRRIFGYCVKYLQEAVLPIKYVYRKGNSPHILYDNDQLQHGIFAVSAKQGDDDKAISTWIGRKAKGGMKVVLDEGTDMPMALMKAFPNLEQAAPYFQATIIGNSNDKFDLHGVMSTPLAGWTSVDPKTATRWETTQKKGLCLYFNSYESPAIHETDPKKKEILSKFLITREALEAKRQEYGEDSDAFYRFGLGFWKNVSTDSTVLSKAFLDRFQVTRRAEWLGVEPLKMVGGLDPAFSTGGDKCILRLGYLGQDVEGNIVLDFRDQSLLFQIQINANNPDAAEIQIAKKVQEILTTYDCPLGNIAVDATGQGRALGGTIYLQMKAMRPPIKIYTVRSGSNIDKSFDVVPKTKHELWFDFRRFVETGNIKGLDALAASQFATRMIVQNPKTLRQELEGKREYKHRMGSINRSLSHSPDEADACALALQSAMINYGFFPGQKKAIPQAAPGIIQEIAQWKFNVKQKQEEHSQGKIEMPRADFKGGMTIIKGL